MIENVPFALMLLVKVVVVLVEEASTMASLFEEAQRNLGMARPVRVEGNNALVSDLRQFRQDDTVVADSGNDELIKMKEEISTIQKHSLEKGVIIPTEYVNTINDIIDSKLKKQSYELQLKSLKLEYLLLKGKL